MKKNLKIQQDLKKHQTAWYIGGGALLVIAVLIVLFAGSGEPAIAAQATLYKSASCGCCGVYATYAGKSLDLKVVERSDMDALKTKLGVPENLRSCHTTVVDGYFIEGHVPKEAIKKLLTERPDIKGIALPGMPSGTPGMPGQKRGAWIVSAVGKDGSVSEFMTV